MKVKNITEKENLIRAIEFNNPEWIPITVEFVPALYIALRLLRFPDATGDQNTRQSRATNKGKSRLGAGHPWLWLALSACASMLLLATTNQMTQDIAVIPFLWVLPLTLYLLSFILCFANARRYSRWSFVGLFVATFLYCWVLAEGNTLHIVVQLAVYAFLLFVACMVCHSEMVRLRPEPERLTKFYLIVLCVMGIPRSFYRL